MQSRIPLRGSSIPAIAWWAAAILRGLLSVASLKFGDRQSEGAGRCPGNLSALNHHGRRYPLVLAG
jgi:hypothetical protein